jgi:hypothetical protein
VLHQFWGHDGGMEDDFISRSRKVRGGICYQ